MENKLTYTKVGDYYIPNLTVKPSPPVDTAAECAAIICAIAVLFCI